MSQAITKVKARIKSVTGAYKVTSAMELVSTVKLKTWRSKMLANRVYAEQIKDTVFEVLSHLDDSTSTLVNGNPKAKKNLYVVISSSLGLCGAYNSNIFKLAGSSIKEEDDAIILGKKGLIKFNNGSFNKIDNFSQYGSIKDSSIINRLSSFLLKKYLEGEYKEIHLIYTEYKNPIAFISKDQLLLPVEPSKDANKVGYPPLLEPSKEELIQTLVPFYIETLVFSRLLESEVCEHASRSNAMGHAKDNAEELLEDLQIEFNKARQGAITQEIIEIVGAAESL